MQYLTLDKIIDTRIKTDLGGNQDTGWFAIAFLPELQSDYSDRIYWSPTREEQISTWNILASDGTPELLEVIGYPLTLLAVAEWDYRPSGIIKAGYPSFVLSSDALEEAKGLSPYYIHNDNGFSMTLYPNGIRVSYRDGEAVLSVKPSESVIFEFDKEHIFIGMFLYLSKEEMMSIPKVAQKICK
ncbi:MAG: hypothetical protein IT291_04685 [Deltaproteobacteria bacterium]|nr:hypothetical protein [Deltaproteobacteria bacterium]